LGGLVAEAVVADEGERTPAAGLEGQRRLGVWGLMQLERRLRPDAYGRVRGGDIARRRPRASGTLSS
jgi:hypothetical protein